MTILSLLDLSIIVIYLSLIALFGIYQSKKNVDCESYFLGGHTIPGFVIGISMMATSISSITFLAYPAAAYAGNWNLLCTNLALPVILILAIKVIIPSFRRNVKDTAYEFLEFRFGPAIRIYGAITFLLLQLIRVSTVIFLVALPLKFLTGLPTPIIIIGIGLVVGLLSINGGLSAVVWTDFIQAFVLILGGLLCLTVIALSLPIGISDFFTTASEHNKFDVGSMSFNLQDQTFWTTLILGFFTWTTAYSADQNVVQRYLAAQSDKEANKATWVSVSTAIPTYVFFFFLGTALYVYYTHVPDQSLQSLEPDEVLPFFIVEKIPSGITGLIIAAILSAAISSLSSNVNAFAYSTNVDILQRFFPNLVKGKPELFFPKLVSLLMIAIMISLGCALSYIPKKSIFDLTLILTSMLIGCIPGIFLISFISNGIGRTTVLWATALALIANGYLVLNSVHMIPDRWSLNIHGFWTGILVNLLFCIIVFSWVTFDRLRKIYQ